MRSGNTFSTIKTEGGLLPADFLRRIAGTGEGIEYLETESYHLVKGEKIKEAISRSWNRLVGAWSSFCAARKRLNTNETGTTETREKWMLIMFQELGYGRLQPSPVVKIEDREYKISHFWNHSPIHLVGCNVNIDKRSPGIAGASKMSPFGTVQEFLNRSDSHLWGFVSNGLKMRILRDNISLTRQAYIEFDLESMMEGELYSDFAILWLICHQSRFESAQPENCILEKWVQTAQKQGIRMLDSLRDGVTLSITAFGAGFLSHSANDCLRQKLKSGTLSTIEYYRQLLRLVYRLLFLFAAEDRNDLLMKPDGEKADIIRTGRELYLKYYSTLKMRSMAGKIKGTRHSDLYKGLELIMRILGGRNDYPELALPALGSFLWSEKAIVDIAGCEIENRAFLDAVRSIAYTKDKNILRPVDYKNIGSDELGSVYESLLELHPDINSDAATFELKSTSGSERKTTGSYYTPDSLVQCLLDTALEPVVKEAVKKPDAEKAILALKICDPACGSGHFLIAAAHRMAKHLARARSGDEEPSPEFYKHALRDVISNCIYGVDINPMAVELCKVNLWMESIEPGRTLSFFDHHIKCGNSLMGATPAMMKNGIPDEAFTAITGDDKKICAGLKKENKVQKTGQLDIFTGSSSYISQLGISNEYEAIDRIEDENEKGLKYGNYVTSENYLRQRIICDAWCAAFVWLKSSSGKPAITNGIFFDIMDDYTKIARPVINEIENLRNDYNFFHMHVEFPDVFKIPENGANAENEITGWDGGFDCVLGNPPWERTALEELEFFVTRSDSVLKASTTALRKIIIAEFERTNPTLYNEYVNAKRKSEAENHYYINSNLYPLGACGRLNTYAIFTNLGLNIINIQGRLGMIVQTGIATDAPMENFWRFLIEKRRLISLIDFENKQKIFSAVHAEQKFALLTLSGISQPQDSQIKIGFWLQKIDDLNDDNKVYKLKIDTLKIFSPNTTQPILTRYKTDLKIVKHIYENSIICWNKNNQSGPAQAWVAMTSSAYSEHCKQESELNNFKHDASWKYFNNGEEYWPLLEAKQIHQFQHSYASYENISELDIRNGNPCELNHNLSSEVKFPKPRFWANKLIINKFFFNKNIKDNWILCYRDVTNVNNERTAIATIIPAIGMLQPLNGVSCYDPISACSVLAAINSFVCDYISRLRFTGRHLNVTTFSQLPIPIKSHNEIIIPRVLELIYTAIDLKAFALDCGYDGPPFIWNDERRFMIRCELDATYFHLYEIKRDDVEYIMDTFPITKRKDIDKYGEYRTKRVILEIYDEMAEAVKTGKIYKTRLNPLPGDPAAAHKE